VTAHAMQRPEWIDAISREHVLEVAAALSIEVQRPRGASGGSFACPACNAQRRHPKTGDRRLACGVRAGGGGWRCFECDAHGDQLHLVAIALEGRRYGELRDDQKSRVRAWVQDWTRTGTAASPARPRLALVTGDPTPAYPPPDEVLALWNACGSVRADDRIARWLSVDRGLDVAAIATAELCVSLPWGTRCPRWAGKPQHDEHGNELDPKPWSETAYRCLFPLFDHEGRMRNLLARFVGKVPHERVPKSRAAYRFARTGLVLADRGGRDLLAGELEPGARVVIAEGEMDLLAFAIAPRDAGERVAVLGIVSGSWTTAIAARVPDGATVVIATHLDRDGEKYAAAIVESLAPRLRSGALHAERWAP
jgi:hypothetical protein